MIVFNEIKPFTDDYIELRKKVGFFDLSVDQAYRSLNNALRVFCAYDGERLAGMGRLIGDGAVICYIQDVMVDPEYQGHGIGKNIVKRLIDCATSMVMPGTQMYLGLMSVKGTEEFYERLGFIKRPNERFGSGLTLVLKKEGVTETDG